MVGGPFGSKLVSRDYVPEGIPVIRGANLPTHSRFSFDDLVFVTDEKVATDLFGNLAFPGDIVVTQRGTLGQVGLIPDSSPHPRFVVSQSQMKLTVDRSKADPLFVYYALRSPVGQHEIRSRSMTAGVPHINLSLFQQVRIPLPPLATQRKIATIFSAYDDLIENNNRRIKLLEEMAQRIYREWFIDFRYPGREGVPLVDSELGLIPEGWNRVAIGEWAAVVVGSTPSRTIPEYWRDGTVPWINSGQINDLCVTEPTELITEDAYASTSTKMMPVGTTLVAITGATLGQVSYLSIKACGSQNVCGIFTEDPADAPYLYYAITNSIEEIANRSMGGAQQHINRGIVHETLIVKPNEHALSAFCDIADGVLREIVCLLRSQNVLRNTRDLLLPRLISGAIDVTGADIAMPEAAA